MAAHVLAAQDPGGASVSGVTGLVLLLLLGLGTLLSLSITLGRDRRRRVSAEQALRADVDQGLALLAAAVHGLEQADADGSVGPPGAPARSAVTDAAERLRAARALRSESDAPTVVRAARRATLEGLAAARCARTLTGADPGPQPPQPALGDVLAHSVRVRVGGVDHRAEPVYVPGHPRFFAGGMLGGDEVPAGWYATAFWEPLLARLAPRGATPQEPAQGSAQ